MIIVYTPKVTNRIKYTLDTVIEGYLGLAYFLTENRDTPSEGLKINYSPEALPGFFNIYQTTLLLEEDIKQQELIVSRESSIKQHEEDIPVIFACKKQHDIRFDIFASCFYLLSRYEEYLPHEKDQHGRYLSSNSILSNEAFHFAPIIEIWLTELKEKLKKADASLLFKQQQFQYIPTIDIDNAFKYKGRNWFKKPPNIFKKECREVLLKSSEDPYNTVVSMAEQLESKGFNPILFFLMSDEDKQDSNVDPRSESLRGLLQLNQSRELGIHPSYRSTEHHTIRQEKILLEQIKRPINLARQHFLRISFPEYFTQIIGAGIEKDYSLAYPDVIGFRAGYSKEFFYYDLLKNEPTRLILQPTSWMDATYEYYKQKKEQEIKEEFFRFFNQLKKINANLVTIFHNDLFATNKHRSIFNYIHQKINSQE